ncbi:MAG TPA: methionine ABC transporter substrate-binding protein, partial [Eubacteriaceae bacterium]|nr:methionine ABC transporter substrate-binding protein [Eubacteriaceae bacterium]
MKKKLIVILLVAALVLAAGCSGQDDQGNGEDQGQVLKIGATPVPHYEILEFVKPML